MRRTTRRIAPRRRGKSSGMTPDTCVFAGQRIVITGGSGFLGQSLARYLEQRGAEAVIISRTKPRDPGAGRFVTWDGRSPGDWQRELARIIRR